MTVKAMLACLTMAAAFPASATTLPIEATAVTFSPFDFTTQGTQLAAQAISGEALTFTGILRSAVYRNTFGTLDFYYQAQRTGAGDISDDDVRSMTAANFRTFQIDAMFTELDPDGAGIVFTAADNAGGVGTANRNSSGAVIGVNFGSNALQGMETSAAYIFRTNATAFNDRGTFGMSDGSTFSGRAFQPVAAAAAVPEPTTWAMIVLGFGVIGTALRGRRRQHLVHQHG